MWKNNWILAYAAAICLSMAMMGCGDGKENNGGGGKVPPPQPFKAVAPAFNADSAYSFVEKQLSFGPRIPNSRGHDACADWIVAKFKEFGGVVTVQRAQVKAFDGTLFNIQNIIASYNPTAARRVMVTAHWDTRPYADKDGSQPKAPVPGANDAGSGVAVILEAARQLSMKAPGVGVDFMLWDAEDYGTYENNESWCLGSQYWAKNQHQPNYRALYGINLDMVGAKDARFSKDGYSMQNAQVETDKVWNIAHNLGFGAYFPMQLRDFASIDDHYFVMQGAAIPMVEVIDRNVTTGEFFPHWHTTQDDLAAIDRSTLKAVGQTVLEVLYREP